MKKFAPIEFSPSGKRRARANTNNNGLGLSRDRDQTREAALFRRRAFTALALVIAMLLTLVVRLAQLQVVDHAHFTTLSEDNRVRLQALTPTRGLIFDRNGVVLAENLPSHRLEIIPEELGDFDASLKRLRQFINISAADVSQYRKLRGHTPPYSGIPIRFRLTDAEVARLAVEQHRFPGVTIRADLTRRYPFGHNAAHIVGYVGRINEKELLEIDPGEYSGSSHIGKIGIEKHYESVLRGKVGYQQVETNAQGRVLRVLESTPPIAGKNIYLSVDIQFQQVVEQALADYNGAVVALDPRNGEVLAMASLPTYDPNPFVNGIDRVSYRALNNSPDRPLFNRAILGMYPPGSTIKPMLGLAGIESGVYGRGQSVHCSGYYRLPGHPRKFNDWKRGGHGRTALKKAITQSCDVYFYQLALEMGVDLIHQQLAYYGFGQHSGIDLSGEKSGLLPSQEWKRRVRKDAWYAGETLNTGIGQGYWLVTPMQLAHATATLALQGRRFQPRLVLARQDQGGGARVLEPAQPLPPVLIKDLDNWRHVVEAMTDVVHANSGTARRIGVGLPYKMAGKTGTAQVFSLKKDEKYDAKTLAKKFHDHALFIAFAPVEAPRIAVAVIAEHGGGGSRTAAPIARQVIDAYLLGQQQQTQIQP